MANIPSKTTDRISAGLKRFQPILESARTRDVNESDTSIIVTDLLSDLFGYDKYAEVTREHAIRGTFCDLAIVIDKELHFIIEVKAIGIDLKDAHVKQAVDYAANQGTEWVILTNGDSWKIFRVTFTKPIDHELVLEFTVSSLSHRNSSHIESLYNLSREGLMKGALPTFQSQQEATNRFFLTAVVLSDPVIDIIRREVRRLAPEVRTQAEDIKQALINEVLKREVIEGQKADDARKKVQRVSNKLLRAKRTRDEEAGQASAVAAPAGDLPDEG